MSERPEQPHWLERWLTGIARHPAPVLIVALVVAGLSMAFAVRHVGVDSDTVAMFDEDLPFRQTYTRFRQQFPNLDHNLLAVVEGPTPEQTTVAAERLVDALRQRPDLARSVSWAPGSDFFARNGLLYLPLKELESLSDRLARAQPLLGQLARQTHAATLFDLLTEIERNPDRIPPGFERNRLHAQIAGALEASLDDRERWLSWQSLIGAEAGPGEARQTLVIDPVLDHSRVLAGRRVMEGMQTLRNRLGLDRGPTRLFLTGNVALGYEEMQSVISGARLTGLLALGLVSAIMLIGLRSVPLVVIALVNLALGLAITAGFAALAIGRVNLISVAFVVLYIGLGVNYAVHYLLRYREMVQFGDNRRAAVIASGRFLARALVLSALTTALGFFAFVPTAFSGVAQLGLIAGVAMLVTLVLSYTTLPAMLAWWRPRARTPAFDPDRGWRRMLEWPLRHRTIVSVAGALLVVAALPAVTGLRFDADPLNLRDPDSESVETIRRLFADGDGGYRNIQILLDAGADPDPMLEALRTLPTVERVVSLADFVPANQDDKLMLIEDLEWILGPDIVNADWQPEPVPAGRLRASARALHGALDGATDEGSAALSRALERAAGDLAGGEEAGARLAERINRALVAGLAPTLGRLGTGLNASQPVARQDLPKWLIGQFRGRDGTQLIQVFPAVDVRDFDAQRRFTEQVLEVAPERATGGPVIQLAAGEAITEAFRQALAWAVIGIAAVLLLVLRDPVDVLKVLAPLVLGGLLTAVAMVALGIPFNFANVVALPLLLGVAVDNGIHLVMRHRAGLLPGGNVLKTATARAIVFGAMITAGGFGNLVFSPHTGTATLGVVLAVGLALMVVATLIFLPALLGRRQ